MRNPLTKVTIASGVLGLALAHFVNADVVETTDGARLTGTIVRIYEDVLVLETPYAGTLEIDQAKVASFSTDGPLALRLDSGTVIAGAIQSTPEGGIAVVTEDARVNTTAGSVSAAWASSTRDPSQLAREAELEGQLRKWSYEAGVDISGSSGNTDASSIGVRAAAQLEGPRDRLRFYVTVDKSERDNVKTAEEYIGGVSYTNFFTEKLGWYIREEIEKDEFESIDFRSTSAGGLTYRFKNEEHMRLEGRAGLSYRYESYTTGLPSEEYPGLELGLIYFWRFAEWGELNTEIVYLPAFEDFGNYRLTHLSTVDFPLAFSDKWKLRLGLKNDYNSEPLVGNEELDTTYFLSLLLSWK